jgi:beta-glucosidase
MFDPPSIVPYASIPFSANDSEEHRQLALEAARESIVLLKNENNMLPLRKDLKSIAVIGPNADEIQVLLGNYNGQPSRATTPLAGIRQRVSPQTKVVHTVGTTLTEVSVVPVPLPRCADRRERGLRAEYFANKDLEGAPALKRVDEAVNFDWECPIRDPVFRPTTFPRAGSASWFRRCQANIALVRLLTTACASTSTGS